MVERIEVRGGAYPPWATERLSRGQASSLPPTLVWVKVVQTTGATATPTARAVAHVLAVEIHSDGRPRPVSVGALARHLKRSKSFVTEGANELASRGFLRRDDDGNGRTKRYTLTLPMEDPDLTGQRSGSSAEADRTDVRSDGDRVPGSDRPDLRPVTPDRTAITTPPDSGQDLTGQRAPESLRAESIPSPVPGGGSAAGADVTGEGDGLLDGLLEDLPSLIAQQVQRTGPLRAACAAATTAGHTRATLRRAVLAYDAKHGPLDAADTSVTGALRWRIANASAPPAPRDYGTGWPPPEDEQAGAEPQPAWTPPPDDMDLPPIVADRRKSTA